MDTKTAIVKAFVETLREKPIDDITVGEIAQRADVSRQTFYNLYEDKYDLLKQCFAQFAQRVFIKTETVEDVRNNTRDMLKMFAEDKQLVRNAFFSKDAQSLKSFFRELTYETDVFYYTEMGLDTSNEKILGAIRIFANGTASFLLDWFKSDMATDPEVAADQFTLAMPVGMFLKNPQLIGQVERAVEPASLS